MSEFSGQLTHIERSLTPLLWIPLLPLVGAILNALFGRRMQASQGGRALSERLHIGSFGVSAVAVGAMLAAFLLAVANVAKLVSLDAGHRYLSSHAWQMVRIGSLDVNFSFAMDPLSAVMTLVVTGVGLLIHIYACSYMEKEPSYWRFFTYMNLFAFAMLLLVLGDNFIVMFFGWEGVGLCSYLLIGFWYKDYKKATAGTKAFVVNRVGDWGVVCGVALLFWGLGGAWLDHGRFQPDVRRRLVAMKIGSPGEHPQAQKAERGVVRREHPDLNRGDTLEKVKQLAGAKGFLTMTTYPGAKVYLGVSSASAFSSARPPLPIGTSPFLRQPVSAGHHNIAVVPGDGAVVSGDGVEIALLGHVEIKPGEEKLITTIGPTVTFRELEDQLAMKDASGKAFLKAQLAQKTVWGISLLTLACVLLFVGATGKSAQLPLHVWLPDAMAGPTPVSALIHAATMVTAGVYLIARLNFMFSLSPAACGVVALTGAVTALFAATIGFFQYDIKKVLAYSTVSQLGLMFIGVGVGAYWAGIFHLMTHAFFKACLFLGSGSVIHGMHAVEHDEVAAQDMRNMGGLRRVMPLTARTYLIACIAITAAPIPLFAGFWSKEEILWKAFTTESTGPVPGVLIYALGLVAAVGTSFYMWRSYYLTFEGPHAKPEIAKKVHESPPAITWVLLVLAFFSAVAGAVFGFSVHLLGGHGEPLLEEWLRPSLARSAARFAEDGLGLELALMALSVAGALAAWTVARRRYGEGRAASWALDEQELPGFTLLHDKYYVDELYQRTVVRGFMTLRLRLADIDTWIVDGIVNATSVVARAVAWINGAIDEHIVDGLVNLVAEDTLVLGERLRRLQTGRVQQYMSVLLAGVIFFAAVLFLVR